MLPWMWSSIVWWLLRALALIMFAIVNDLMFAYNVFIVVVWSLVLPAAVYGWLLVHTCYLEFASITRLEDLAHLRVLWRLTKLGVWSVPDFCVYAISNRWEP